MMKTILDGINQPCDLKKLSIEEMNILSQEIRDAITNGMKKDKLRELVYNTGVITLLQDGLEKVVEGETTLEEVLKLIELDDDEDTQAVNSARILEIENKIREKYELPAIKMQEVLEVAEIEAENDEKATKKTEKKAK